METKNKIVQKLTRIVNTVWFGLGLPEMIAALPPGPVYITKPPFGPGDPRYHRGFKVEDVGTLTVSALAALDAVGKLL